jgi:hypothetical protein
MGDFVKVVEWLRWPLGLLFVYVAAFVREDEEGAIQNRLEELWIRLMYTGERALSKAARFMSVFARSLGNALDALYGDRLWSWRSINASLCLAFASSIIATLMSRYIHVLSAREHVFPGNALLFKALCAAVLSVGLLLLVPAKGRSISPGFFAGMVFGLLSGWLASGIRWQASGGLEAVVFRQLADSVPLICSFISDVVYISVTRWMLRKVATMKRVYEIVSITIVNVLLVTSLYVVPLSVAKRLERDWFLNWNAFIGDGLEELARLNFINVMMCLVFFAMAAWMLAHRLLWPMLERPVYALQRYGVIRKKALLWGVATALWFGPKGMEGVKYLAEKL